MSQILGDISAEEHEAGRGMLSVIVTHKTGDMEPGPGFYELAAELGLDVSTDDAPLRTWVEQMKLAEKTWAT
jgi:hypothetical protein